MLDMEKVYYSKSEAAVYLGLTVRQLKYQVQKGNITPCLIGKTDVLTRRQLDDFKANGRTDIVEQLYGTAEAVKYTGILPDYLKTLVGNGEKHRIGHSWIYEKEELDGAVATVAAKAQEPADPPVAIGARIPESVREAAQAKADQLERPMTDVAQALLTKWLEGKVKHQPQPSRAKGNIYYHVHVPQSLHERLRQKAEGEGVKLSRVAADLLQRWVAGKIKI